MVNVSRHGGTKNKYVREFNHLTTQLFNHLTRSDVRTQGDHLIYHYPGAIRPVVIPKYREVPVFIIRNNMKIIGMSRKTYLELLQKV